jgi:hypothetical protein
MARAAEFARPARRQASPVQAVRAFAAEHPVVLEAAAVLGFLALIFLAYGYHLGSVIVSDMDEGTYLLAGKLVAEGQVPYRDFMLTHPPAIAYLLGWWVDVAGPGVMPARIAYSVVVLGSTVPLYLLARSVTASRVGGVLSIAAYTTGMLLLANMGRTIRLEPLMNAALIAGTWMCLRTEPRASSTFLAGALLAGATLVKLVAAVPTIGILAADVLWRRAGLPRRWLALSTGAALVAVPAAIVLLSQPRFLDDVIMAQFERPGLPLGTRVGYLLQDLARDPLVALGFVAAIWFAIRGHDGRLRTISLIALVSTFALIAAFRTFFGYYLVQVLPWLSITAAAALLELSRRLGPWISERMSLRALAIGALCLATLVPLGYEEVYYRTAHDHGSSAAEIVGGLAATEGPMYSMYPSFALWTGRETCGSYYAADSLIARITGRLADDDFVSLFARCPTLVLWTGELDGYPRAKEYVAQNFSLGSSNLDYALWTRRSAR